MATYLITCRDYSVVREVNPASDLPALCREAEAAANDGYAVFAKTEGRIVADADGYSQQPTRNVSYEAGYAYACGYQD